MDSKNSSMMLMVGGALLAIGSFMAWATAFGISVSGMDGGDGWFTLLAGVALLALGFMSYSGKAYPSWLAWVALAVGAAVALINFFDIMGTELIEVGIGMWLMVAGVVVAVLGLVMGRKSA
ncbi:MAG: hypothetical protein WEA29_00630 [Acidimicrobiia bacterium]